MKRVTKDSSIVIAGEEYPINTNRSKQQGCYVEILRAIDSNITAMLSFHCKVFVVPFVVHCHEYEERNQGMSDLMRVIKKRLKRKYKCARIAGGWVRETSLTGVQHYHVVIFLDGNKVNWFEGVQELIIEILEVRNYQRPSFVRSHMIKRGDRKSRLRAFYHLSYYAKTRSKTGRLPETNDYSFSRLKPKKSG